MSNIKELIRAEIERLKQQAEESKMEWVNEGYNQNAFAEDCRISSFDKLLSFLDTLPDEPVTDCHELTEAAEEYSKRVSDGHNYRDLICGFIAGAEWQKRKMIEGATYNELMELYRAIRDELVKRHCDVPVNIKEEQ